MGLSTIVWVQMDYYGIMNYIMGLDGLLWDYELQYGFRWTIMGLSTIVWVQMDYYGIMNYSMGIARQGMGFDGWNSID